MKKTLLTLLACIVALGASSALQKAPRMLTTSPGASFGTAVPFTPADTKVPMAKRAAGQTMSMTYSPAYDPYQAIAFQDQETGMQMAQAFQFTRTLTNEFAGNKLTGMFFYTGINMNASTETSSVNTIKKATMFLAYDLQNFEPFYTQTVDLPEAGGTLVSFQFDTPYEIVANKPLYIGFYYYLSSPQDATVIIDGRDHGNDATGGWIGFRPVATDDVPNPSWSFNNFADRLGFLCLGTVISGDNLPTDKVSLDEYDVQPSVYENEPFDFYFLFTNNAANDINSIDCEVTVGTAPAETVHMDLDQPLGYSKSAVATLSDLTCSTPDVNRVPVTVTITKVNGNPNNDNNKTISGAIQVLPTGKGYQRNVVIEEFTGTWCGFCPQGIVTMEALREKYTDGSVIPVAVHYNDPMAVDSYFPITQAYSNGNFPSAVINRSTMAYIYPTDDCVNDIELFKTYPAPATVTATAMFNEKKNGVIFNTKAAFSYDNDKASEDYILAFAVTEDNVGPYEQNSNYPGTSLPGWGDKPAKVETIYNDVARQINSARGLLGTIPESVVAGQEYEYTYELKFTADSKIEHWINLNAIVYLLNRKTGIVENACMVKAGDLAAIDNVFTDADADADAPVEYYNLQGIRVSEPAAGIYIRRQGSTAKVVAID